MEKARKTQIHKMNKANKYRRETTNEPQIIGENVIGQNEPNEPPNQQISGDDQNIEPGIPMNGDLSEELNVHNVNDQQTVLDTEQRTEDPNRNSNVGGLTKDFQSRINEKIEREKITDEFQQNKKAKFDIIKKKVIYGQRKRKEMEPISNVQKISNSL